MTFNIYESPEFESITLNIFGTDEDYPFEVIDLNKYQIMMVDTAESYTYTVYNEDSSDYVTVTNDGVFEITETAQYTITATNNDHGCSSSETVDIEYLDIEIPNVFNPGGTNSEITTWYPDNLGYIYGDVFSGYSFYTNMEVMIFDRYGRLLQEYEGVRDRSSENGWNGTYNGKPLPTGDYWYHIILNDSKGRVYTGHFTLYRKN